MVEDNILEVDKKIIYKSKLDLGICNNSINFINTIEKNFTHQSWLCPIRTSLNTTQNILNIIELSDLKINILKHLHSYMYTQKSFFDGYIFESWVNIYEKGFYQEYHNHLNLVNRLISGVVYLTDENSDIEFNMSDCIITPKFGDILIFDESLMHRALPNDKDSLRVSLAFNYKKCGEWYGINLNNG